MHYYDLYESPQGRMLLVADGEGLSGIYFDGQKYLPQVDPDWRRDARHAPLRQAKRELAEYFGGERKRFETALAPEGTPFQQDVWKAISTVGFGRAPLAARRSAGRRSVAGDRPSSFSLSFLGRMRMGAAYGRRHDLTGDVKVPDRSAATCSELRHQLGQIIQILERLSGEPESARDAREIAVTEHRPVLGHPFRAELVQLGAVRAVVHHDDQDVQPMALDGFKLLHMHHQAAVAVEQHDGSIRTRRRDPHGERDAVADRAELADGEELLLWTRRHLRKEP